MIDKVWWNPYCRACLPPCGEEVLAYNSKWVNYDFNPRGIRVGFRTDEGFVSAFWWDYQDDYIAIDKSKCESNPEFFVNHLDNTEPEYWLELPSFKDSENLKVSVL